ncbi:MAG: hypothetical protein E6G89_08855 [Alphaproteobacteria bacterium]|nr:MAG: hypothetical protein E6G89_08855 [Alphaproteobacteria bacterium]
MTNRMKLSVSAAALSLVLAGGVSSAQAADVVAEPGCRLNGSVMAGYMYDWQNVSNDIGITGEQIENKDVNFDGKPEWETPFGEGAALFTCGGLNIQGDFACYGHEYDGPDDIEIDQTNKHGGGAIFYRDPDSWAGGISASRISQKDVFDNKDPGIWRVGVFGEVYLGDAFTLGGSAHYYNTDFSNEDELVSKDEDGFELAAWGRFYPTPNFSILVRGDLLLPNADLHVDQRLVDLAGINAHWDVDDGWAVTGEAEYLVWDSGLSIFGGARYAERSWNFDIETPGPDFKLDSDVEDFQVYAGLKFYFDFGRERTLVEDHRTGAFDNTSVFHEKLPELMTSTEAGLIESGGGL